MLVYSIFSCISGEGLHRVCNRLLEAWMNMYFSVKFKWFGYGIRTLSCPPYIHPSSWIHIHGDTINSPWWGWYTIQVVNGGSVMVNFIFVIYYHLCYCI